MYDILQDLLDITKRKYDWYLSHDPGKRLEPQTYIHELNNEIEETQSEMRTGNTVYLEDECSDILWDYLNFIYTLEKQGYISSVENVLKRCKEKYEERITDKEQGVSRAETKTRQKQKRQAEAKKMGER